MPKVAYQGIPGANSEIALRQHFGDDVECVPSPDFNHLFDALQTNKVDYSLLPVENVLAGSVAGAYEMLLDHDVRIQAEVILHVHHALLAVPGADPDEIRFARSHPQALMQCERYLKRHNLEAVGWYDTAGSAQDLAANPAADTAVIATELAGELYGLQVLARHIEDEQIQRGATLQCEASLEIRMAIEPVEEIEELSDLLEDFDTEPRSRRLPLQPFAREPHDGPSHTRLMNQSGTTRFHPATNRPLPASRFSK